MINIWTVYDHPSDYPDYYVARMFRGETPTDNMVMAADLDTVRDVMARDFHLVCLTRHPDDDPKIIETWL
jgi:hypothetical protein